MKFPNFVLPVFTLLSFLFTQSLAQSTVPYDPSPFSSIGIVQAATVNDITDVLSGGTLLVNGLTVIIPRNLLVTLPSITVSWQELFKPDETLNLPMFGVKSWEVSVTGNFVGGEYIAGLVYIFQELLHTSSGFISNIDYATGELRIGGSFSDPTTGTRVIINDPVGRFGKVYADWPLLTADTDNPSIKAMTGFPMCIPRFDPATTVDPLCPKKNRPTNSLGRALQAFNFDAPPVAATRPDPNVFAPLMKGDYVFFSGVYVTGDLIAAYSIEANLGLYTALGRKPSYLTITTAQWGIVGDPAGEIAETRVRIQIHPIPVYRIF
ncbi:hypothetical protein DFH27DRAFT_484388 [Peziza echinospora]|nr:hypothetical protein DFH27DRAFT_484388 [Peziza echinospora]